MHVMDVIYLMLKRTPIRFCDNNSGRKVLRFISVNGLHQQTVKRYIYKENMHGGGQHISSKLLENDLKIGSFSVHFLYLHTNEFLAGT